MGLRGGSKRDRGHGTSEGAVAWGVCPVGGGGGRRWSGGANGFATVNGHRYPPRLIRKLLGRRRWQSPWQSGSAAGGDVGKRPIIARAAPSRRDLLPPRRAADAPSPRLSRPHLAALPAARLLALEPHLGDNLRRIRTRKASALAGLPPNRRRRRDRPAPFKAPPSQGTPPKALRVSFRESFSAVPCWPVLGQRPRP